MSYRIRSYPIPDELAAWETMLQTVAEDLVWLKNPQVITLPRFAKLWVLSEVPSLPAAETAKEAAKSYLRKHLEATPETWVFCDDVYQEYLFEHQGSGLDSRWFGRMVFEVFPNIRKKQIRSRGKRVNVYHGLAFKNLKAGSEGFPDGAKS